MARHIVAGEAVGLTPEESKTLFRGEWETLEEFAYEANSCFLESGRFSLPAALDGIRDFHHIVPSTGGTFFIFRKKW